MKKASVLYIDDEVDTQKFASKLELIEEAGIKVIPVGSVDRALNKLEEEIDNISLVILDIIMPPLHTYTLDDTIGGTSTGFNLLADIRKQYPSLPIIIVSIKRMSSAKELIDQFNVSKFLEKPISASHIISSIFDVLGENRT